MLVWAQSPQLDTPPSARVRPDRRHKDDYLPVNEVHSDARERLHPQVQDKNVDRIAEAWGIHEPEPYEEFSSSAAAHRSSGTGFTSAASSVYGNNDSSKSGTSTAMGGDKTLHSKPAIPPPEPLRLPATMLDDNNFPSSPPSRSRSVIGRIRKIRDIPDSPVISDMADNEPNLACQSDIKERNRNTGHRHHNSLFGRFGRSGIRDDPVLNLTSRQEAEEFVFVRDPPAPRSRERTHFIDKALPPPPAVTPSTNVFPASHEGDQIDLKNNDRGIAPRRRTSLLRKMKDAVRGGPRSP